MTELVYEYVYWPFSVNSCECVNSVYQATLSWTGNEAIARFAKNVLPSFSHFIESCRDCGDFRLIKLQLTYLHFWMPYTDLATVV